MLPVLIAALALLVVVVVVVVSLGKTTNANAFLSGKVQLELVAVELVDDWRVCEYEQSNRAQWQPT